MTSHTLSLTGFIKILHRCIARLSSKLVSVVSRLYYIARFYAYKFQKYPIIHYHMEVNFGSGKLWQWKTLVNSPQNFIGKIKFGKFVTCQIYAR